MYSDNILKQYLYLSCFPLFCVKEAILNEKIKEILLEIEEIKEYMEGKHE